LLFPYYSYTTQSPICSVKIRFFYFFLEIQIVWYRYSQQQILPPVHEGCNCYIETLPGGNTIWQFTGNTCETCKTLAREYNQRQNSSVNEPAQINPVIPEPPAIIEPPTEEPLEEQVTEEETNTQPMLFRNFNFTPKRFYDL
jgi:hypothetical protein